MNFRPRSDRIRRALLVASCLYCAPFGGCAPTGNGGAGSGGKHPATCIERQEAYVNTIVSKAERTDATSVVQSVLEHPDGLRQMPYCSGTRPD